MPDGYADATYEIQTNTDTDDAWREAQGTAVNDDQSVAIPGRFTIENPRDTEFMVRVVATAEHATSPNDAATPDITIESDPVTVDAIEPSATGVSARRQDAADSDEAAADGDFVQVSWSAVTNTNSAFRVVAQVSPASTGGSAVWVVLNQSAITGDVRMSTREIADGFSQELSVATATGTGSPVTVTDADLNGAGPDGEIGTDDDVSIMLAVESVQGAASADNEWKRSAADALAAKTAAGNGG